MTRKKLRYIMLLVPIMTLSSTISGCSSMNKKKEKDPWFGPDKIQHFAYSAVIGASTAAILKNNGSSKCEAATGGIGFSLAIGAGKEYYDKYIKKTQWSWKDMFWDLAGGAVGSHLATGCH